MSTTIYVLSRNVKKYQSFLSEKFHFLVVKFSIYLNRHVFVMYLYSPRYLCEPKSIQVVSFIGQ